MKKFTIILFPALLLGFCLLGMLVQKDKNKLEFYFQNDIGSPTVLKDLKYEFSTIQGNLMWKVKGKGEHIDVSYISGNPVEDKENSNIYVNLKAAVTNASLKDIPAMCNGDDTEDELGCYFSQETKQLKLKFQAQQAQSSLRVNGYDSLSVLDSNEGDIIIQQKNGKPFDVLYTKESENDYGIAQLGKVQDTSLFANFFYNEVKQSSSAPYYFYMSEALLRLDLSKGDFICKSDVGGIYQVDEKDQITRLVPMQLGEEDIYMMFVQEHQLYCLVRRHDQNYIVMYDKDGKKLRETEIKDIAIAEQFKSINDGNIMLAALQTDGAERLRIYDSQLKLVDEIVLLQEINDDACTYQDGILYTMSTQGEASIKVNAYQADGVIYDGRLVLKNNMQQSYNMVYSESVNETQIAREAQYYNQTAPWFSEIDLQVEKS